MPEIAVILPFLLVLLVIGAIAGIMAGLLGIGGGIILVPAFYYCFLALGYHSAALMQICLATSLATIIVTSIRSLSSHHKKMAVDWNILRTWSPGLAFGALIGVFTVFDLHSTTLLAIFGVLGISIGIYIALNMPSWRLGVQMPNSITQIIFALVTGFFSVLMGIGGGVFGVSLMTLYGVVIHRAIATAAGFGLIIALPAVVAFLINAPQNLTVPPLTIGHVNLPAFFVVACMTIITTPFGTTIAHRLPAATLRRIFAGFIIIMAGNMLRQAYLVE